LSDCSHRTPTNLYKTRQLDDWSRGFNQTEGVQQWTAIYYAMVEQVDVWVGVLLDELDKQAVANDTLVIFTADHGEMLGAFGLQGKATFYDPSIRVPLLMRLPNDMPVSTTVTHPVGHIDVLATIMDYLGYSQLYEGDGKSLRPAIEQKGYRKDFDDEYAVSEVDPDERSSSPSFMVRYGSWKLLISELQNSTGKDALFNLTADSFERTNLLDTTSTQTLSVIGKAEHLKCLLLEWMIRNDGGSEKYYSDPKWNGNIGRGDLNEVRLRRRWRTVGQWLSDQVITMKAPVFVEGMWRSNAWLYLGRTTSGTLTVSSIALAGSKRSYFTVDRNQATIGQNDYVRIKVSFVSATNINPNSLGVSLVLKSNVESNRVIKIK
jgi:hypothetical protein